MCLGVRLPRTKDIGDESAVRRSGLELTTGIETIPAVATPLNVVGHASFQELQLASELQYQPVSIIWSCTGLQLYNFVTT